MGQVRSESPLVEVNVALPSTLVDAMVICPCRQAVEPLSLSAAAVAVGFDFSNPIPIGAVAFNFYGFFFLSYFRS